MDSNFIYTSKESKISTVNSTNTPLWISGVFTGEWEDTLNYSEIIVSVFASVPSITDGLRVQWSADGTTIHQEDTFTISASSGKTFSFQAVNKYFRVKYTNDWVAQVSFSLQTTLKIISSKGSSHRLKDTLSQEDDATVTTSLIKWFSTAWGGQIVDVKVSPSGAIQVWGDVWLVNTSDVAINPATEEGLQDIVTAVQNITIPAPVWGATEAKQDSLEVLTYALYEIAERLTFLTAVRWTLADLRVTPTGNVWVTWTLTWVTTVTTLSNMGSVGWYLANPQIPWMMNNTAIQSNITNITIT